MKKPDSWKRRSFTALVFIALMLVLSLPNVDYAFMQPPVPGWAKGRQRWGMRTAMRKGMNFTVSTDLFTVRFAGSLEVPKFQYWYTAEGGNRTVYQVFFHQLFEFNDTSGDGVYNATYDKIEQMFALPSANLSLVGPEDIKDEEGNVVGVRFNFTISGRMGGGLSEANITLQCSLYNETYTHTVADGIKYNVTGGAELKIDVIINSWPFKDDDNMLCLRWSVNQQDATLEPSVSKNSVTFGRGYFSWLSNATIYNGGEMETVNVTSSFNMTGRTVNIYMCYPNFRGRSLIHDPSLGVTPIPVPEDISALDELQDYLDRIPTNLNATVLANRSVALLFQNLVMIVNSSRNLELDVTVESDVAMHYFSLSLIPGKSLSLTIKVAVSPPADVVALDNDIDFYLSIEPNETVTIDASLKLYIDEAALEATLGRDITVSRLSWAYWDGSSWVPVDSLIDADGYLVANTTHFSVWTIVEIVPLQISAAQLSAETVTQGETVTISATVKDESNNPITGATVTATIADTTITLTDQGDGNYQGTIETSTLEPDTYSITLTARKDGYTPDTATLSLTVQAVTPWTTYALIALAVAAVAVAAAVILMRRR